MSDDPKKTLTGHELETELLADWRLLFSVLHARFETGDFATGLRLVAPQQGHRPHPLPLGAQALRSR